MSILGWVSMLDDCAARRVPARFLDTLRHPGNATPLVGNDPRFLRKSMRKGLLLVCLANAETGLRRLGATGTQVMRPPHLHAHPDTVQGLRVQAAIRALRELGPALFGEPERNGGGSEEPPNVSSLHSA